MGGTQRQPRRVSRRERERARAGPTPLTRRSPRWRWQAASLRVDVGSSRAALFARKSPEPFAVVGGVDSTRRWAHTWRAARWQLVAGAACVLGLFALPGGAARAAEWAPSQPVELIVPAGIGGGADQMARLIERLNAAHGLLGQPLVVINKSRGDGAEGLLHMKASASDPHKLLMALSNLFTTPRVSGIPVSYRQLTPVGMLALDDFVLWVHASSPFSTARSYFEAIRAAPDATFSIGGTGLKQEDQLLTLALQKQLGKKLSYVPFRGGGEVAARLAAKQVTCSLNNPGEALEAWQKGELRPLCVFRADRMPFTEPQAAGKAWSDIPTCKAEGVELEYRMLRGIFLPGGVAPEAVAYYAELLRRLRELPEWRQFMAAGALEDRFLTGSEFSAWLAAADALHGDWMRDAGLLPQPAQSSPQR